ncbi:MAG: hypothetical protein AB1598_07170 [Thermodesulfobacteriota bacterium]
MPTLDYLRIVGISDIKSGVSGPSDVTFNIEYSGDPDFSLPKMGVITLRMDELLDIPGLGAGEMEKIATRLVRQVLVRERDKDGTIIILHILGLPLGEWLRENVPFLRQ